MTLTRRQREVFEIIEQLIARNAKPPTIREIGAAAGIRAPNGVVLHLAKLEAAGLITLERFVSRGIRIVGKCPVCGRGDTETEYRDVPMPVVGHVRVRTVDGGKLRPGKVEAE